MQKLAESLSLLPRTSHYIVNHRIHNKDRINQNLNVSNTVFLYKQKWLEKSADTSSVVYYVKSGMKS